MIYIKKQFPGGIKLYVPFSSDEMVTNCVKCGKEVAVNMNDLLTSCNDLGVDDFADLAAECEDCQSKEDHDE